MSYSDVTPNDPGEMKISAYASWLCNIFQKHKLTADEKKYIIQEMTKQKKEELRE